MNTIINSKLKQLKTISAVFIICVLTFSPSSTSARTKKSLMEDAVFNYLHVNFNRVTLNLLTLVGNVEISNVYINVDGTYTVEGEFEYKNFYNFPVKRKFKAGLNPVLDDYTATWFKYYAPDLNDNWVWLPI